MPKQKKLILTIDYEIFFGKQHGTVDACMIVPTEKLLNLLSRYNAKMTIFWDILHFVKLAEYKVHFPELEIEHENIKQQILRAVKMGCDVQLHLHPHWLDTVYFDGKWEFKYDRFSLHKLVHLFTPDDPKSVAGCLKMAKDKMEEVVRVVDPDYRVTTFRAGGYLIEPFDKVLHVFRWLGIKIDSSVLPGMKNKTNRISQYNFLEYPSRVHYHFSHSPKYIDESGEFLEIPVSTIKLGVISNLYFKALKRFFYKSSFSKIGGLGVSSLATKEPSKLQKLFNLFRSNIVQLTTDSNFRQSIRYLINSVPEYSTMILHPKLLTDHQLCVLSELLANRKIVFVSIKDYLKKEANA